MGEALHNLGIDWKLFIAQIVNFALLAFILYKVLYKPLLKMLADRTEKIDKSLKDAEKIEAELAKTEENSKKIIAKAEAEADKLVEKAITENEALKADVIDKAKADSEKYAEMAKRDVDAYKDSSMDEVKREAARLVAAAVSSLATKDARAFDDKLIDGALKELGK